MGLRIERGPSLAKILDSRLADAQKKALYAEATIYRNELKRNLRHGYISSLGNSGDFTTGTMLNHIFISEPLPHGDGWEIRVGTDLLYPLYWEIGHHNIFTRGFERDPVWGPTFEYTRTPAREAYIRVLSRFLKTADLPSLSAAGD
jgi:hypothetical protein